MKNAFLHGQKAQENELLFPDTIHELEHMGLRSDHVVSFEQILLRTD